MLDKLDGFIRVPGGGYRYLVLFDHGLFNKICDKIKYLTSGKSDTVIFKVIFLEKVCIKINPILSSFK